jgi:hypothetical protein
MFSGKITPEVLYILLTFYMIHIITFFPDGIPVISTVRAIGKQ